MEKMKQQLKEAHIHETQLQQAKTEIDELKQTLAQRDQIIQRLREAAYDYQAQVDQLKETLQHAQRQAAPISSSND